YDYVQQEMELFRANGAWLDLVSIGNEVNDGMFTTTGAERAVTVGHELQADRHRWRHAGTANCFPRIQRAALQASPTPRPTPRAERTRTRRARPSRRGEELRRSGSAGPPRQGLVDRHVSETSAERQRS